MNNFFPLVIILAIVSLISNLSKRKRDEQAAKARAAAPARQAQPAPQPLAPARKAAAPVSSPAPRQEEWTMDALQPRVKKEADVMRPRANKTMTPAPARMGQEGEDDCHAYMLTGENMDSGDTQVTKDQESMTDEQAKELLRGVIFSEILRRPARRLPYGRRA